MHDIRPRWSPSSKLDLPWIGLQTALVLSGVFIYFRVRGITESDSRAAMAHARQVMDFQRTVGLDLEDRIQEQVSRFDPLVTLAN